MTAESQPSRALGNPAAYTCMAVEFNLQTVASLINYRKGNALGKFAGAWVA